LTPFSQYLSYLKLKSPSIVPIDRTQGSKQNCGIIFSTFAPSVSQNQRVTPKSAYVTVTCNTWWTLGWLHLTFNTVMVIDGQFELVHRNYNLARSGPNPEVLVDSLGDRDTGTDIAVYVQSLYIKHWLLIMKHTTQRHSPFTMTKYTCTLSTASQPHPT
jgi:hypothetical protein